MALEFKYTIVSFFWKNIDSMLYVNLNRTDNYDVAKIKVKSVTDHQVI